MLKRSVLFVFGIIVVVAGLAFVKVSQIRAAMAQDHTPPPSTITSAVASEEVWQQSFNAVGGLTAVQGIIVNTELDGTVARVAFDSGSVVKQGDLLLQQDISSETAQLGAAEARAELARISLERARDLREKGANSQSELDVAVAESNSAKAAMANIRATIDKKTIRAPFSGRVGIRLVNLGQFLKGGTAIVPLYSLDPIYADFSLPQQEITSVAVGQAVHLKVDAFPGEDFVGKVTAINPQVDPTTRNIQVQATLSNPDGRLRPGMFVNVELMRSQTDKFITVPITAISYNPYGDSVFIIEENKDQSKGPLGLVARQQFVKVGPARGNQVAVLRGVSAGQTLASSGLAKLRNGAPVVVNNQIMPSSNPAPKLADS